MVVNVSSIAGFPVEWEGVLVLGLGAVWLSSAIGLYWLSNHLEVKILDN